MSDKTKQVNNPVRRAVLRYFGGKWAIAPWVLAHLPPHRIYVEPFGGAASVLLRKQRSEIEVYNDLDGEIVSLFRVLQDPVTCAGLVRRLRRTPYARAEFERAFDPTDDPVIRAQRTIVRAYQSFHHGSVFDCKKRSFADARHRTGTGKGKAGEWVTYPRGLVAVRQRLQGVVIECRDALAVIKAQDTPQTLFFVDPPYLPATRSDTGYRHELTTQRHAELLQGDGGAGRLPVAALRRDAGGMAAGGAQALCGGESAAAHRSAVDFAACSRGHAWAVKIYCTGCNCWCC